MVSEPWKSICCVPTRVWLWSWTGRSISGIRPRTVTTGGSQLLQENEYLVLRFLAEDVGKDLDLVLDTILRALSHRQRSTRSCGDAD